jgi:hypothetical protein
MLTNAYRRVIMRMWDAIECVGVVALEKWRRAANSTDPKLKKFCVSDRQITDFRHRPQPGNI